MAFLKPEKAIQFLRAWADKPVEAFHRGGKLWITDEMAVLRVGAERQLAVRLKGIEDEIAGMIKAGGAEGKRIAELRAEADEIASVMHPAKMKVTMPDVPDELAERSDMGISQLASIKMTPQGLVKDVLQTPVNAWKQSRAERAAFNDLRSTVKQSVERNRIGAATGDVVPGGGISYDNLKGIWQDALVGPPKIPGAEYFDFIGDHIGQVELNKLTKEATKQYIQSQVAAVITDKARRTAFLKDLPRFIEGTALKHLDDLTVPEQELATRLHAELMGLGADLAKKGSLLRNTVEDYVPHLWEGAGPTIDAFKARFSKLSGRQMHRRILNIEEGEKAGLKLKFDSFDDMAAEWFASMSNAATNRRFFDGLRNAYSFDHGLPVGAYKHEIDVVKGAAADYVKLAVPGLEKYFPIGRSQDGRVLRMAEKEMWIHKDVAPYVHAAISTHNPSKFFANSLVVNSYMKSTILNLSMFHHMALTMGLIAQNGGRAITQLRARANLGQDMLANVDDILQILVKNGLDLGAMGKFEAKTLETLIDKAAQKWGNTPILGLGIRTINRVNKLNNYALWDYGQRSSKIVAAAEFYQSQLRRPEILALIEKEAAQLAEKGIALTSRTATPTMNRIAKIAAERANASMGGLAWRRFLISPRVQNHLRIWLLAPDWSFSNLLVAAPAALNLGMRGQAARQYTWRAVGYFGLMTALLNRAFTGHDIWDNPEGHKTHLQLPWRDSKGRAKFVDMGKQFDEPLRWMSSPIQTLSAKLGVLPRAGISILTSRNYFGNPIVTQDDDAVQNIAKRLGYQFEQTMPITVQQAFGVARGAKEPSDVVLGALGLPTKTEFVRERSSK